MPGTSCSISFIIRPKLKGSQHVSPARQGEVYGVRKKKERKEGERHTEMERERERKRMEGLRW